MIDQNDSHNQTYLLKNRQTFQSNLRKPNKQSDQKKHILQTNQSIKKEIEQISINESQIQKRKMIKLPSSLNTNMNKRYSYNAQTKNIKNQRQNRSQSPKQVVSQEKSNECQIYFDKQKKSNYVKNIVDKYFDLNSLVGNRDAAKINSLNNKIVTDFKTSGLKFKRPPPLFKDKSQAQKERNNISLNLIQSQRKQREDPKILSQSANHFFKDGSSSQIQKKPILNNEIRGRRGKKQEQLQEKNTNESLCISSNESKGQHAEFPYSHPFNFQSSFLPPIYQVNDIDDFDQPPIFESTKLSSIVQLQEEGISPTTQKQTRTMVFQNSAYTVWLVFAKGKPKYRLKEYKAQGVQILKRQKRFIERYQIANIWKQSKYNHFALMSLMIPPIKDLLFRINSDWENKAAIYKITPKSYQKYLLSNGNIELHNFIRDMCILLKKVQGKVLNNKINPNNIFLVDGKPTLAEWGQAAFRQEWNIQIDPVLRSQTEWFATPEYLSPEMLRQMTQQSPQGDLWQTPASSDIWSLGLTVFQIVTCIPVWSPIKCIVKGKAKSARSGIFGIESRSIDKIMQRQKKVQKTVKKCLLNQFQAEQLSEKTITLILKMLEYQPEKRITLDEILQNLSS